MVGLLNAVKQPGGEPAVGVLVTLVAQELDPVREWLLDLVAECLRGGGVVIATTEASAVDRLPEPEIQAIESGDRRRTKSRARWAASGIP